LVLGALVTHVDAELVAYWKLDAGSGDTAYDSSSAGNDGTLEGGPQWVAGYYGAALALDGTDDNVDCGNDPSLNITDEITLAAWINMAQRPAVDAWYTVPWKENAYSMYLYGAGDSLTTLGADFWLSTGRADIWSGPTIDIPANVWTHIAVTFNGTDFEFYVNGEHDFTQNQPATIEIGDINFLFTQAGSGFAGLIDEVQVYNHALSAEEIQTAMQGLAFAEASVDSPADGAVDVIRDVRLAWTPGAFASTHDVYLGTAFADVNAADIGNPMGTLVSQGQTDESYDAGILDFGQTYYWRIDEVNGAPDNTIFKGDVWSFTVEPFAIPVEAITATASSSQADNMGPENTIGGIGLNELDQHSTEATEMWISGMGDATPSIQYEFDKAYKLHEMWVWNSNQLIEAFLGIGAKDVVIEYSLDGAEWTILEDATQFAQAPGAADYVANTIVDFGGVLAQYVKITVDTGYGMLPQYGLSEVRFLYVPTFAREPQPTHGGVAAGADVELNWRAGREAASHEVYFGTDPHNLALVATVSDNSHAAVGLLYNTAYYWQIVEVNEAETPASHIGDIWSFSTAPFAIVDNFEQYNNECKRIFFVWSDGLGHNGSEDCGIAPYNGNGTGAIIGHAMPPFAERTIVHGGSQSMPLEYDGASEAKLILDGQDWTAQGLKTLSLYFRGKADNTGQLFVQINGSKIPYDGDPANISLDAWTPWNIDLSTVSGDLSNVTSFTVGMENGSGMLYVDDIQLNPASATVQGSTTYSFDDLADDSEALDGIHGGIDFGSGAWWGGDSWYGTTKCAYFADDSEDVPVSFTLPANTHLVSIVVSADDAYAFTVSDGVNAEIVGTTGTTPEVINTGWTNGGRTVTVTTAGGWEVVFDDITYSASD